MTMAMHNNNSERNDSVLPPGMRMNASAMDGIDPATGFTAVSVPDRRAVSFLPDSLTSACFPSLRAFKRVCPEYILFGVSPSPGRPMDVEFVPFDDGDDNIIHERFLEWSPAYRGRFPAQVPGRYITHVFHVASGNNVRCTSFEEYESFVTSCRTLAFPLPPRHDPLMTAYLQHLLHFARAPACRAAIMDGVQEKSAFIFLRDMFVANGTRRLAKVLGEELVDTYENIHVRVREEEEGPNGDTSGDNGDCGGASKRERTNTPCV